MNPFNKFVQKLKEKKGAAMVEYGLLVAGVGLVSMAAVSLMGHKTSDLYATVAAVLPGAHEDNGPIVSGKLIETTDPADGGIAIDVEGIAAKVGVPRLGENLGMGESLEALVLEAGEEEGEGGGGGA